MESLKGKRRGMLIKYRLYTGEKNTFGALGPYKSIEGLDQPWQGRETRYNCSLHKKNHLSCLPLPLFTRDNCKLVTGANQRERQCVEVKEEKNENHMPQLD
jgi:hypothetical protein